MNDLEQQSKTDVETIDDIDRIVRDFYSEMLEDSIVGFIFTDVIKIDLELHIPIIVDFWSDIVFKKDTNDKKTYRGNVLRKHLEVNDLISLKPGHFTRWLFLFEKAVDKSVKGDNAALMKKRARLVADSISSAIDHRKRGDLKLTL